MAIEQGIVTRLGAAGASPTAWVQIVRSGACESCASRHSCNVGSGNGQEVETLNAVQAGIGDRIQVVMDTGSLLKATFLLYVFPILAMLAGGLFGHGLSVRLNLHGSLLSVLLSVAFLVIAMIMVRITGRRMGSNSAYQPRILRIIGRRQESEFAVSEDGTAMKPLQEMP